ncbi:hypothetical protein [Nitrogeniibacter aestuarii]|uniref:hypothetical protein n=1 Tax=Nitrogeniibacter aestuarii TaxID=2815343 RepID=UPI001E406A54|nr:hypothetical protein [Nitrogeniibacter aestuarii]
MTYGMNEFIRDLVEKDISPDDQIYDYLSDTDIPRLEVLLHRLDHIRSLDAKEIAKSRSKPHPHSSVRSVRGRQAAMLGKVLEQIMLTLLKGCRCISVGANIRSTTSEIDFLVQVGPLALVIPIFKSAKTHLIGEAKCYSSGFKSEWVNELVGIMQLHSANHSIIFTASPSKVLRAEHRHAIQLHGVKGDRVIPFGLAQVKEIAGGKNFLKVLSDQYVRVLNATNDLAI